MLSEAAVRSVRWKGSGVAFPGLSEHTASEGPAPRAGVTRPPGRHGDRLARDVRHRKWAAGARLPSAAAGKGPRHRMPSALPLDPPQRLVRTLASQHGHAGEELGRAGELWLAGLPALLDRTLERWDLTRERVVSPGGRSSLVVAGAAGRRLPAALKLLAPYLLRRAGAHGAGRGGAARWDGWGAVRLLRSEAGTGRCCWSACTVRCRCGRCRRRRRCWKPLRRHGGCGSPRGVGG